MIGGMIGHEARDGHAERDEAIERRVRAEFAEQMECSAIILDNLEARRKILIAKNAALSDDVKTTQNMLAIETNANNKAWVEIDTLRVKNAEQAALIEQLAKEAEWNRSIQQSVESLLTQAGYHIESSSRHQLLLMNFDGLVAVEEWRKEAWLR